MKLKNVHLSVFYDCLLVLEPYSILSLTHSLIYLHTYYANQFDRQSTTASYDK